MLRFTLYRSMFGAMIISSDLFIWRTHRPEKPGRLHNFTSYPGRTELLRVQLNHFWSLEGKRLNINLHRFSIKLLVKYLNIQIFNCKKILKGSVILTYLMNSLIVYWNSAVWLCCILKSRLESLYFRPNFRNNKIWHKFYPNLYWNNLYLTSPIWSLLLNNVLKRKCWENIFVFWILVKQISDPSWNILLERKLD